MPFFPKININYTKKTIVDVKSLNDNKRFQQGVFKIRFIKIISPLPYTRDQLIIKTFEIIPRKILSTEKNEIFGIYMHTFAFLF